MCFTVAIRDHLRSWHKVYKDKKFSLNYPNQEDTMTAFSTADDLIINRKIDVNFTTSTATEELENVYEISRCAKWIISNGYEKVK